MKKNVLFMCAFVFLYGFTLMTYGQYKDGRKWYNTSTMTRAIFPDQPIGAIPPVTIKKIRPNTKPHIYHTPAGVVTVNPNFRVHPSNIHQSEVPIVSSSVNRDWLFGSSNAFTNNSILISEGIYLSTNGGQTWFGSDTCGATPLTSHGGDPGPAIGPDGTIYMSYLDLYGNGVHCGVSTDFGTTWGATHNLVSGSMDKNLTTVNEISSSPYYGRVLVAWSDFNQSNPPVMVSWSSNDGSTWSTATDINTPNSGHYCQGVNPQVGPNGEFYIVWANPISSSPYTEDYMGFAKSTDGGVTWTVNNDVYDVNGIRGNLSDKNGIRVNGFPWMAVDRSGGSRNGWIYVVEGEKNLAPAGSDPDIIFHRSTDGGTTWSAGIRVNQDALNDGADQYMPAVCVGDDGSINVVYYDSRNTAANQAEVYMSHSTDGGDSWTDVLVSDHTFTPAPIPGLAGGYQGDYIGIAPSSNGVYYPLWCDNSTGIYQAWTAAVTFEPPCLSVDPPTNPNPADGATGVSKDLAQLTWDNGTGVDSNEVFFGTSPANLTMVQAGSLSNSYNIPSGTLQYNTNYYWRIKQIGDTCNVSGPVWSFTVMQDPNLVIDTLFNDPFTSGCGNWTITNDGGTCVWDCNHTADEYNLGSTAASGTVLAADADFCGSGSSLLSTATLTTPINASIYTQVVLEWDQDWLTYQTGDNAYVEVSTDGGTNWTLVVSWLGLDASDQHESYDISALVAGHSFQVRFRTIQPTWDWWWAVDNVTVIGQYSLPVEFTSFNAATNESNVSLNWATATETNNKGFEIQRKSEKGDFAKIGFVNGAGTSSQPHTYSYVDSKLTTGKYTYRLKQVDLDGSFAYSKEVNVNVNVPLKFGLDQNYPNPFNPTTEINYTIAKDGLVSLTVYNSLGQEVEKLVNGVVTAGQHRVSFDASRLASGVYYYRLVSNGNNLVKKMMLLK